MEDFVVVWRPLDEEAGGAWEIRAVRRRADCYWVPEACMWICSGCPDELGGPAEAAGDGGDGGDGGDADGRARVRLRRASAPGRFQPPCVE